MCSSIPKSTLYYDCEVKARNVGTVVGRLGDVSYLRPLCGRGFYNNAGEIYWITDRTPHEGVPLAADTYRQFFRLVTTEVSVWYEEHSAENPTGVQPGEGVRIIKGSKFVK